MTAQLQQRTEPPPAESAARTRARTLLGYLKSGREWLAIRRTVRVFGDRLSFRFHTLALVASLGLVGAAFAASVVALSTGDFPLPMGEVVRSLVGLGDQASQFIVVTLRLPRILVALLVGAALGVSGAIFQSISRNPLGSPDIIGFNVGAATGAVLSIVVFDEPGVSTAVLALVGGLVTAVVVYLLSYKGGVQGYRLVLVGIGVSSMLTSVNSYLLTRADLTDAMRAQVWLTGSLNGRGWEHVWPVLIAVGVLFPIAFVLARPLAMMEMGDDAARSLGINVERTRLTLVLVGVGLSALAVSAAGPIGFIALAAPQLARRLLRAPGVGLVSSALMGAFLLILSDVAAQRVVPETELPVGVMTGAVGGVYLAWLLARGWRRA